MPGVATSSTNTNTDNEKKELTEEQEKQLLKQIEFYFSDWNYNKDAFLKERGGDRGEQFIKIEELTSFNRVKNFTTNVQQIANIIKQSKELQVDESQTQIKRNQPLPEIVDDVGRTLYVKNFDLYPEPTVDELVLFFGTFGKVEGVTIRKYVGNRKFKGSVFVTFETKEDAENCLKAKDVMFKDNKHLIFATREEYFDSEYATGSVPSEHVNWSNVLEKARKADELAVTPSSKEQFITLEVCDGSGPWDETLSRHDLRIAISKRFGIVEHLETGRKGEPFEILRVKLAKAVTKELLDKENDKGGINIQGKTVKLDFVKDEEQQRMAHRLNMNNKAFTRPCHLGSSIKMHLERDCQSPDEQRALTTTLKDIPGLQFFELRKKKNTGYIHLKLESSVEQLLKTLEEKQLQDAEGNAIKFSQLSEEEDKDFMHRDRDMNFTTFLLRNIVKREDVQYPERYCPREQTPSFPRNPGNRGRGQASRGRGGKRGQSNNFNKGSARARSNMDHKRPREDDIKEEKVTKPKVESQVE